MSITSELNQALDAMRSTPISTEEHDLRDYIYDPLNTDSHTDTSHGETTHSECELVAKRLPRDQPYTRGKSVVKRSGIWARLRKHAARPHSIKAVLALNVRKQVSRNARGNKYISTSDGDHYIRQETHDHYGKTTTTIRINALDKFPALKEYFLTDQRSFGHVLAEAPSVETATFNTWSRLLCPIMGCDMPEGEGSSRLLWQLEDSTKNPDWKLGYYAMLVLLANDTYYGFQWLPSAMGEKSKRLHVVEVTSLDLHIINQ